MSLERLVEIVVLRETGLSIGVSAGSTFRGMGHDSNFNLFC